MTKEEILNGMSEEEFYQLYPTKEAWEEAQQQMAYGGIPPIMGTSFGAGITMAKGGTPCFECGGYKQVGGVMTPELQGQYPIFGYGGYDSPFNYGQFPAMKSGGDLTSQGGNQDFLGQRNGVFMNYIKNNVLKNMHKEESQKVQDAFNQMEYGNMQQMSDGSMMPDNRMQYGAQLNTQNQALQDMYAQNIYKNDMRRKQDFQSFADMTTDFLGQVTAQYGRIMMPNWEYSNYVPQNDIRTGYSLGKSDFAKLAKLQGQGKITGAKFNYGALGRFMPRVFGPKSIEVGYINPNKGMFEDLKEPISFDNTEIPETKKQKRSKKSSVISPTIYGLPDKIYNSPLESGIRQSSIEKMMNPFSKDAQRQLDIIKNIGPGPQPFPADNSWEDMMNKKNNVMAPYSEQFKAYGGLYKAQKGFQNPVAFTAPLDDEEYVLPPTIEKQVDLDYNPFTDQAAMQKRRQEQLDMFGAPMNDQPDLFASDTAEFKKKTIGVGRFLGKNAPLIADTISSALDARENRKNKQKINNLMLADNAFVTTPTNAKNRGDYDINSGILRPDKYVYESKFGGPFWGGFNTMQDGGFLEQGEELDLSPEEIDELRQQGYQIEYLD